MSIGLIALWLFVSLVLYIIVEGIFFGGWKDADVRGARSLLKWSFLTAILPLHLLVRSFKRKNNSEEKAGDEKTEKKGDNDV